MTVEKSVLPVPAADTLARLHRNPTSEELATIRAVFDGTHPELWTLAALVRNLKLSRKTVLIWARESGVFRQMPSGSPKRRPTQHEQDRVREVFAARGHGYATAT